MSRITRIIQITRITRRIQTLRMTRNFRNLRSLRLIPLPPDNPPITFRLSDMKLSRLLSFFLSLSFLLAVVGCDKVPDNGRLDGMWQLMAAERDGVVEDMKPQKRYWCIRYNILQLSGVGVQDHYAHFEREGETLRLFDFCYFSNNATEADDNEWIPYEERDVLLQWGLVPLPDNSRPGRITQSFHIDVLNASDMVLSADGYTLRFRRF